MKNKILVIEDNEQNMYLVKYILEAHGYLVLESDNGPEGITIALSESPDLILLDIQLPGMDGYDVARALKKEPALRQVPIVAVTSYAMPGDRENVLAAGCTGYIEKPIDPDTFIHEVRRYLNKS